jgi:ankyrin repeat protein
MPPSFRPLNHAAQIRTALAVFEVKRCPVAGRARWQRVGLYLNYYPNYYLSRERDSNQKLSTALLRRRRLCVYINKLLLAHRAHFAFTRHSQLSSKMRSNMILYNFVDKKWGMEF